MAELRDKAKFLSPRVVMQPEIFSTEPQRPACRKYAVASRIGRKKELSQLTALSRDFLLKLMVSQLVKYPVLYSAGTFITCPQELAR